MLKSQSPQAGQFNSYIQMIYRLLVEDLVVSIPSSGSIQFLPASDYTFLNRNVCYCLNPLKRVNSILTRNTIQINIRNLKSQSPQAGQFNSYKEEFYQLISEFIYGLNPLKRVNSILTVFRINLDDN